MVTIGPVRLATISNGTRDGELVVLRKDAERFISAKTVAPNLQSALDQWDRLEAPLQALSAQLNGGKTEGTAVSQAKFLSPLPRAYEWVDGSAFLNHVRLVRKARGAEPPPTLETDPLIYQGGSGIFLSPTEDLVLHDTAWGLDYEAEICVVLGDVPIGTKKNEASKYIRLLMACNDVTYRNLIPAELAKGFGFFQSKPATAFAPFALTPDELDSHWKEGRLHLPVRSFLNGKKMGDPNAGPEMHFSFFDLIEHIAKTRAYTAGTILGSGTVSNQDRARGVSCLAEIRTIETLDHGKPSTPFMVPGDRIEIEVTEPSGAPLFGKISQKVVAP